MNFCYESKVDSQSKLPVRVGGQSVAVRFLARSPPPPPSIHVATLNIILVHT